MILFSKRTLLESKIINYLVRAMDQTCINQFHQWFASRNGDQQLSCTNIALIALHQSGETENPVASSVGQEGLFLALPFFRLQLSAQLLLGPERRTRARILYSFFFFFFSFFFLWQDEMGLIYTGEDEERERDKYGRPCLSVWVNGVHFMLVTVKSTTRAPSNGRPYPSGTTTLWRERERYL